MSSGLSFQAGAIGAGGLSFAYGTWLDDQAAVFADLDNAVLDSSGSSTAQLFPEWSAGVYGEMDFTEWIGVRLEPRWALFGASRLALTDVGETFSQYGLYFSSVLIPLLVRGYLAVGPGAVTVSAGPFIGIVAGPVFTVDRRADLTTTAAISANSDSFFFGLSGGAGYTMEIGPGVACLELRADWSFTSIASTRLGGELYALGTTLAASYGIRLGGDSK